MTSTGRFIFKEFEWTLGQFDQLGTDCRFYQRNTSRTSLWYDSNLSNLKSFKIINYEMRSYTFLGFTRQLLSILEGEHVKFGYFDILSDNEVREGLKKYSNWPTYPQLYVNG